MKLQQRIYAPSGFIPGDFIFCVQKIVRLYVEQKKLEAVNPRYRGVSLNNLLIGNCRSCAQINKKALRKAVKKELKLMGYLSPR